MVVVAALLAVSQRRRQRKDEACWWAVTQSVVTMRYQLLLWPGAKERERAKRRRLDVSRTRVLVSRLLGSVALQGERKKPLLAGILQFESRSYCETDVYKGARERESERAKAYCQKEKT